ncbi:hypothetical protein AGMMS50239_39750 [Bacteroidia bacterium]|nr:hypothetical protein AGMMS50239_39750 [Bacteroidia bacterium]
MGSSSNEARNFIALTSPGLRSRLTTQEQLSIYEQLIPGVKLGRAINCPYRKDENPSFSIYKSNKSDNILFRDWATGEGGNVELFMALMKREVAPIATKSKIADFKNSLDFISRTWAKTDFNLWAHWGITPETLIEYNVEPAAMLLVNGRGGWKHTVDNPIYVYKYGKSFKAYRPKASKISKWKSEQNGNDVQGYEQLPETGNVLIITKSLKDVMSLKELGYSSVAASSETTFLPRPIFADLKKRFKHIILFFDNDRTGIAQSEKIKHEYNIPYVVLEDKSTKDISDYICKYGMEDARNEMSKIIYGFTTIELSC